MTAAICERSSCRPGYRRSVSEANQERWRERWRRSSGFSLAYCFECGNCCSRRTLCWYNSRSHILVSYSIYAIDANWLNKPHRIRMEGVIVFRHSEYFSELFRIRRFDWAERRWTSQCLVTDRSNHPKVLENTNLFPMQGIPAYWAFHDLFAVVCKSSYRSLLIACKYHRESSVTRCGETRSLESLLNRTE